VSRDLEPPNGHDMYDALLNGCRWLENTPWGTTVRGSPWMYPIIEWIHFIGLSVWLGTSLSVDLRLMDLGNKRQTAAEIFQSLFAWNWIGFGVAFLGGFLLFAEDATTYVSNTGFRLKLGLLIPLALFWHVVVQRNAPTWGKAEKTSTIGKCAGLTESLLWISVIAAAVEFLITNAVTRP
jgi:hypothetical protein